MKKISIIVPVYNGEKYLLRCLKSIQRQTHEDFEVLLINDCSKDQSAVLIQNFIAENAPSSFTFINNEKHV